MRRCFLRRPKKQENVPGVYFRLIRFLCLSTSTPSAGLLPYDLTGITGTHRGLAVKESWMKMRRAASRHMLHEPVDLSSMVAQATAEAPSGCARDIRR